MRLRLQTLSHHNSKRLCPENKAKPVVECFHTSKYVFSFLSFSQKRSSGGGGSGGGKEKKRRHRDRSTDDKKNKKKSRKSKKSSSSSGKKKDGKSKDKKGGFSGGGSVKMMGAVDQNAYGKNGVLREADYFSKQREFEVSLEGVFCLF